MAKSMSSKGLRTVATSKLRDFIPTFPDQTHHTPLFNTLTATASDLQKELSNGKLRSTQVVEEYHRSVIAHNGVLNAVWQLAPGAMKRAEELDLLREKGQFLGPLHLHGIPILVKVTLLKCWIRQMKWASLTRDTDNINLDPSFGIGTSGGAVALVDSVPASSATIVEKLLEAGAIILGKTTMSEMAYFKGSGIRCGWSAAAGQSQSAYVRGSLDMEDSVIGHSSPDDIKVGTLEPEFWALPHSLIKYFEEATTQMSKEVRAAYSKIEKLAKTYHGNISKLALEKSFDTPDGEDAISAALTFDIGRDLDPFLQDLTTSKIRSLKELVKWKIDHADVALTAEYPNQDSLVAATEVDHDKKKGEEIASHTKAAGAKFLELFTEYDVDVIIAPTDSPLFLFSGAGAFPMATLPLSTIEFNGRPFGLTAAARPHCEGILIKVMSAWESTFPARKTPEAFLTLKAIG